MRLEGSGTVVPAVPEALIVAWSTSTESVGPLDGSKMTSIDRESAVNDVPSESENVWGNSVAVNSTELNA